MVLFFKVNIDDGSPKGRSQTRLHFLCSSGVDGAAKHDHIEYALLCISHSKIIF